MPWGIQPGPFAFCKRLAVATSSTGTTTHYGELLNTNDVGESCTLFRSELREFWTVGQSRYDCLYQSAKKQNDKYFR